MGDLKGGNQFTMKHIMRIADDGNFLYVHIYSEKYCLYYINQLLKLPATSFWIGGKDDMRVTGGWTWMGSKTRMNVFSGYRAWRQSYPRNMFTRMFLGTRCAMVKNAEWEDTKCDERLHFACQL